MLTERDAACTGPRSMKTPGSVAWCWQTINSLRSQMGHIDSQFRQADEVLDDLERLKVWEVIPPEAPYGSLNKMLEVEIGLDYKQIRATVKEARSQYAGNTPNTPAKPVTFSEPAGEDVESRAPQLKPSGSYREAAITLWGAAGEFAHDAYARNLHLYPGLPDEMPIVIGITAYGHCLGLTRHGWQDGARISLFSAEFAKGRNRVEDVMIHEMLHCWLRATSQESKHDSDSWYDAVNRLSPKVLGFELNAKRGAERRSVRVPNPNYGKVNGAPKTLVRKVPVEGAIEHVNVARWPYPFRPANYPAGDPIQCPTY